MHQLLAIVEVDKDKRVKCCGPGCKSYVYRRIHVVLSNEKIEVLGSTCYQRNYLNIRKNSEYTGSYSRKLTEEERKLLAENTVLLIKKFEEERRKEQEKQQSKPKTKEPNGGATREVKCHYCGDRMHTKYSLTPALGFKCDKCKEAKAVLPLRTTRRY